ncbi:efflux RND transporter permease subunit [Neorhodopirellula lusitana]|uniref:efflux RND transporter permease subunit n=1 Tax=Neorhodopirellula lusitana TaxID=445327 RepID=UPI00384B80DE
MALISLNRQASIYRLRFVMGLLALLVLAPLSIVGSDRALSSMFNAPALWLPKSLDVRKQYDEFATQFLGQNILLISWDGCDLGSDQIPLVVGELQKYLTESAAVPKELRYLQRDSGFVDRDPADDPRWLLARAKAPDYLEKLTSGQAVYDLLNSPPTSFSDRSVRARLKGALVGPDGKQTAVLASFTLYGSRHRTIAIEQMRSLVAETIDVDVADVFIAGAPFDGALIDAEAQQSIQRYTMPSCLLGALICLLCLRSWLLTSVVIAVGMIGQGISLAVISFAGLDMNAILIVLPPLVFVLTASAGIHLSNYYLDAIGQSPDIDPTAAARRAMQAGYVPCWLAAITTIIGLGSLGMVRLWPVSAFGVIAAGSVFLTLLLLMALLPGAMQWHGSMWAKKRKRIRQNKPSRPGRWSQLLKKVDGWWLAFTDRSLRHPIKIVIAFTVLTAITATGLPMLTTSVNVPRMFPAHSEIFENYEWFEDHLGPTIDAQMLITFAPEAMPDDVDQFRLIRKIDTRLRDIELVGGVVSARSFLPTPPPSVGEGKRSLGATIVEANIRNSMVRAEGGLRESGYYVRTNDGRQIWRIGFRFPFGEDMDYRAELHRVEDILAPMLEVDGVSAYYTGNVPMSTASQDILLNDLFRSFMTAFGVVAIIMMLLMRSVVGGLLAMFPNLFPTVTLFGAMGLTHTPLDIGSVMTASVALGIAVDATIHLLSRFGSQLKLGHTRHEAATEALRICGPAMWQTTAVCGLSPLVYGLSHFVPTQRFALMMLGLLSAALIGDVVLMPAIMASPLGKWFTPKGESG